jgi:Cu(I)/Ag(I) efflux system membrane fusion protein
MSRARLSLAVPAAFLAGAALVLLLTASPGGRAGSGMDRPPPPADAAAAHGHAHDHDDAGGGEQLYMCPMMCVAPQPEPGRCPVCGMDLVPVPEEGTGGGAGPRLEMSEASRRLAEVRTERLTRRYAELDLQLPGKVGFDETRVREISAWVPGRLEHIFVDQTGTVVREGDPLVEIYSRELNAEKATYLASIQRGPTDYGRERGEDSETWLATNRARLRLRGLTPAQIDALERRETPSYTEEILSPIGGTVIRKSAMEGMHVETGSHLYTVADLSRAWVWLDVYERDIPFLRYGQEAEIRVESYGDHVFRGWISFIAPVLDPETRTTRVRVVVENEGGALKPGMFVRAWIRVRIGAGGRVVPGEALADKWISPRHPEILRDAPGDCPVCGIDLVRAEALGYATDAAAGPPLLVPASAVLYTGRRSLVYVRVPGREEPVYEGVTVKLGPRAGRDYVVLEGLSEGDEVVVNGAFTIDSALQLLARPSMMHPDEETGGEPAVEPASGAVEPGGPDRPTQEMPPDPPEAPEAVETDPAFRRGLAGALRQYFALQEALARDAAEEARTAAATLQARLLDIPLDGLGPEGMAVWTQHGIALYRQAGAIGGTDALAQQRTVFLELSATMEALLAATGPLEGITVYRAYCPMAFDDLGAEWLQSTREIANPYEGSRMPRCGVIRGPLRED